MFEHVSLGRLVLAVAFAAWATSVPQTAAADESAPASSGPDFSRDLSVEQLEVFEVDAPDVPVASGAEALEVTAWVDREDNTYSIGDTVHLFVQSNQDAFLTVINVGTSGGTTVLFPNEAQTDNRIVAGEVLEIAGPDAGLRLAVGGPAGAELIKVIASNRPDEVFEQAALAVAGPFRNLTGGAPTAVESLEAAMDGESEGQWAVYDHVLRTLEDGASASGDDSDSD